MALGGLLAALACNPRGTLREGVVAPDFTLPAADRGEATVRLGALRGKPVVLAFVDTQWPEFLEAMEGLERLNRALRRRGLAVVAVFLDQDPSKAAGFVRTHPVTFTTVLDAGGKTSGGPYLRPRAPVLYVLDREGRIHSVSVAPERWKLPQFRRQLEPLLDPDEPGM